MVLKYLPVHLVVAAIRSFRQNLPTAINHDIHDSFFRVLHLMSNITNKHPSITAIKYFN